jgi:hypothetical protein
MHARNSMRMLGESSDFSLVRLFWVVSVMWLVLD